MKINKNRIGEENTNSQGIRMKIIDYRGVNDIDVEFEDGYISYNTYYSSFKLKNIFNPNYDSKNKINRSGEVNRNKYGNKMKIVEYIDANNIIVEFEDGWKTKSIYRAFKNGDIISPFDKLVYNIGYSGEGKYKAYYKKDIPTEQYETWYEMIKRCYSEKYKEKYPTYEGCSVCKEWHNFQVFATWYDENYYKIEEQRMHLDKDIIVKGNKIYSPETCVFVPQNINKIFNKQEKHRGKYPIGVSYKAPNKKFQASLNIYKNNIKKQEYLGLYDTPEQAFKVYKMKKEQYIKDVADYYKDKIPEKLYDAMCNYKVEITD